MLDVGDLEGVAAGVLHRAGADGDEPVAMPTLARRLLGPGAIEVGPTWLRGDGALCRVGDDWRIYVKRGLSPVRKTFAIAHELAEWALKIERYEGEDVEHAANLLGGAILVPRRAYLKALRVLGEEGMSDVAKCFVTTESCSWLRLAEVTGKPLALISPQQVRVRGDAFNWPQTEGQIRRLAKLPAPPGLKRARLRDDPKRIVLEAEEVFDDVG